MIKKFSNQRGFTIVELVLSIAIMMLMGAFIVSFMGSQVKSMMFVADRSESLGDARYALNRISYELMRVDPTTEITSFTATTLYFRDDTGVNTSFRMDTMAGGIGLYRGTTLLVGHIDSFLITYYDSTGAALNLASAPAASTIKRIRVKIVTANNQGEGKIALQTAVTPRSVIGYENFQ